MTIDEAAIRFYEWCLLDAVREQKEGFPLLNRFADDSARRFFRAIRGLSADEQTELMSALVRRGQRPAVCAYMAVKGESLSERDNMLIERFLDREFYALEGPRDRVRAPGKLLRTKQLEKTLKESRIPPLPLQKIVPVFGNLLRMQYDYHDTTIWTDIDIGGRSHHVDFGFSLTNSDGVRLIHNASPVGWLGICCSEWLDVTEDQAPMIVETIAIALGRFCSAVDYILEIDRASARGV
jgi:hypothetical protein